MYVPLQPHYAEHGSHFLFVHRPCIPSILYACISLSITTFLSANLDLVDGKYGNPLRDDLSHDQNVCLLPVGSRRSTDILKSIALWERKLTIVITLGVLCLSHWALLYRGMFIVHADWDNTLRACVVTSTNPSLLKVNFFYSEFPRILW